MSSSAVELEFIIEELDCADEAAQIQRALGQVAGISQVKTVIGARKTYITYDPQLVAPQKIQAAIADLGMTVRQGAFSTSSHRPSLPNLLGGGFVSALALVALVGILGEWLGLFDAVISHIPPWLAVAAVLFGGWPIFHNVVRALRNRTVTSHALMTLGMLGALAIGQYAAAAIIVFFMRVADFLESFTTERSRQAIKELLKLSPEMARVERDEAEVEVLADEVRRGEVVLVKPGERIPIDGRVLAGHGSVNQAPITGESIPVGKREGDAVFAATVCERGFLRLRTERVGRDTTFGRILRLVEEAEAAKAPVQRFADRFTAYYIPVILMVAGLTFVLGRNLSAAVAVVLVSCSCAIAMATPTVVLASVGRAARRGIIVKGGRVLEILAKVDTLVMDKTSTVTFGVPRVTDIIDLDGAPEPELLAKVAAVERYSEHSVAAAILAEAQSHGIAMTTAEAFEHFPWERGAVWQRTVDGAARPYCAVCGRGRDAGGPDQCRRYPTPGGPYSPAAPASARHPTFPPPHRR